MNAYMRKRQETQKRELDTLRMRDYDLFGFEHRGPNRRQLVRVDLAASRGPRSSEPEQDDRENQHSHT